MRNLTATKINFSLLFLLGAVLAVKFVVIPLIIGPDDGNTAPHAETSPSVSRVSVPSGVVTLVGGARSADGVAVGYPHSMVGAISAASTYLDAAASTLDPDYAASVMRVAGANAALPADLAASTATLRGDLQLPTTGPLASPIAFQTVSEMYQLRDATADHVLVLLLTESTFVNAHGGMAQTTGVFPVAMQWADGDWKLASVGGGASYASLTATPFTQAAAGQGWFALVAARGGAS